MRHGIHQFLPVLFNVAFIDKPQPEVEPESPTIHVTIVPVNLATQFRVDLVERLLANADAAVCEFCPVAQDHLIPFYLRSAALGAANGIS
jgi:hypothetical protein